MTCPICRKEVEPGGKYAPFCSERCRTIDLAQWASESYRISSPAPAQESQDEDEENHAE